MESAKNGDLIISRALIGAAAAVAVLASAGVQAAGVPAQGTWETTLQPRDIDGDSVTDAFYDTALDVTWLRNANVNGLMDWSAAKAWADTLVVGGVSDWRLPTMIDTGESLCQFSTGGGTDCGYNVQTRSGATTYSEMAHLFYVTLGNKAYCDPALSTVKTCSGPQPGFGLTNTGNFQNMQSGTYWSGLEYAPNVSSAWVFLTYHGTQTNSGKSTALYALAVHPGDVAPPVPEPQTLALMLAGLGALLLARRRRPR